MADHQRNTLIELTSEEFADLCSAKSPYAHEKVQPSQTTLT
jgi:hypothetical protein